MDTVGDVFVMLERMVRSFLEIVNRVMELLDKDPVTVPGIVE